MNTRTLNLAATLETKLGAGETSLATKLGMPIFATILTIVSSFAYFSTPAATSAPFRSSTA